MFQKVDKQAISLFFNWFKQLSENKRIDESDYQELEHVYKDAEEVRAMLITALEKEREQIFKQGIEKGIEKGKYEDAKIMFAKGMSVSLVSEITGLPEKELLKLQSKLGGY